MSSSTEISALLTADADILARRLLEHVAGEAPGLGTRTESSAPELGVVRAHLEKFGRPARRRRRARA